MIFSWRLGLLLARPREWRRPCHVPASTRRASWRASALAFLVLSALAFGGCSSSATYRLFAFEGVVVDPEGQPLPLTTVRVSASVVDLLGAIPRPDGAPLTAVALRQAARPGALLGVLPAPSTGAPRVFRLPRARAARLHDGDDAPPEGKNGGRDDDAELRDDDESDEGGGDDVGEPSREERFLGIDPDNPGVATTVTDLAGRFHLRLFLVARRGAFLGVTVSEEQPDTFHFSVERTGATPARLVSSRRFERAKSAESPLEGLPINEVSPFVLAADTGGAGVGAALGAAGPPPPDLPALSFGGKESAAAPAARRDVRFDVRSRHPLRMDLFVAGMDAPVAADVPLRERRAQVVRRLAPASPVFAQTRYRFVFRRGDRVVYEATRTGAELHRFAYEVIVPDASYWGPLRDLSARLDATPDDAALWRELGSYGGLFGDTALATRAFDQTAALAGESRPALAAAAHVDLAAVYLARGLATDALARIERAREILARPAPPAGTREGDAAAPGDAAAAGANAPGPDPARLAYLLARTRHDLGQWSESLVAAREGLVAAPGDLPLVEFTAGLSYTLGESREAAALWERALRLRGSLPDTPDNRQRIERIRQMLARVGERGQAP
ncbi:MAG: hypothetical protein HY719_01155 [Planctomycetes bacterium]|nr:hypothetical protein [Planctomycetota bacterium]